jgi:hypothetical protein
MSEDANNDPIGKALGVTPVSTFNMVNSIVAEAHNDSAKSDFETARANILTMIDNGQDAMFKLAKIAEASQHPRAFEVLAKMMDTMLQANKDLMGLQKDIRELQAADSPMNDQAKTINNNLFVGSTSDLHKILENVKNGQFGS